MDWTMIGAVGEILGAVAVVASLVYLGASVRSSARQSRDLAARSVLQQLHRVVELIATDASIAEIWRRGHKGLEELTDDERLRMSGMFLMMIRPYEELFYYRRDQTVDEWAWESALALLHQPMGTPGFSQWWSIRRTWVSTEFRAYVDTVLSETPDNQDLLDQYVQSLESGIRAEGSASGGSA